MASPKKKTAHKHRKVSTGRAYINASFNNTIVCITTTTGDVLTHASTGQCGFKNSRQSTPLAAQNAATKACEAARDEYGMRSVQIIAKGFGPGRESAIRAIREFFDVSGITDDTKVPHNGCRPKKKRRV